MTPLALTWRALLPTESREAALLLNRAFNLTLPQSYLEDFPVWDPAVTPFQNRYQVGGYYGTRLVCTASIRFSNYKFQDGTVSRLGLIGAVATHPEFSGRGYGSEAIAMVIHEGDRRGVDAFVLWGSESSLYKKRKFEFGGKQIRVPVRSLTIPKTIVHGYDFRMGWDSTIGEHLLARKAGLRYEASDLEWLSKHPNVQWRTLWLEGKCLAYCGWNRGIDLPNMIHELDGEPSMAITLLRLLQERYPELEWITHPELLERWNIRTLETPVVESLAQFRLRLLPPERVSEIWFSGMDSC